MKKYLIPTLVFVLATAIALYNTSGFPKMIGDEGIYVSQGYWLTHFGSLGPYTYWYDHFPLGWAQIGLWQLLVGTTRFFGSSVLSARIFMGVILGGTTTLLYLLTHKITSSKLFSLIASLIFITSALTLTFGRMVLLDNLAIFWFLLSLWTLYSHPTRIKNLSLSALFLGISILTKESLLFFLPVYLYSVYSQNKTNIHKQFGLLISVATVFFILSFFPLLALLKNELLPQVGQVSFLSTVLFQSSRGLGIPFWQAGSHFRQMLSFWLDIDPVMIILGLGSTVLIPFLKFSSSAKVFPLFTIFFLIFLGRGGQIYEFYLIPILPLLSLNISLLLSYFSKLTKNIIFSYLFIVTLMIYVFLHSLYPFTTSATSSQKLSLEALKNLPQNSVILAPNYTYLDIFLQNESSIHWYQKIESEPKLRESLAPVTNILIDTQFANDLSGEQLPYIQSLIDKKIIPTQFGKLQAPGEQFIPYTTELLNLYHLSPSTTTVEHIKSIPIISRDSLAQLKATPPYAILITRDNFTSSSDLQVKMKLIREYLPGSLIFASQDSEGHNTIPWIANPSRTFYKSTKEAEDATIKKATALKALGFDGAIIASSDDTDGYLTNIYNSSTNIFKTLIRYNSEKNLRSTANLYIIKPEDLEKLKSQNYQGTIYIQDN